MTATATASEGGTDLDLDKVLREVDDEVRAKRASGELPAGLERDLDLLFDQFSPTPSTGDDLASALEAAERMAFVDVEVPTGSRLPGVAVVKRTLKKLVGWYLRYLAQQVSAFASTVVTALRLLGRRVEALEAASPDPARLRGEAHRIGRVPTLDGPLDHRAVRALEGRDGRLLVAESGGGSLLRRLVEAGGDAYGCDPEPAAADVDPGLEVRTDEALDHLRSVAEGALAGLVLQGCVDRLPVGSQLELAELAAHVLGDGGSVVVLGTTPSAWVGGRDVVESDLAAGRPLHGDTWVALLERRGFLGAECHVGGVPAPLQRTGDAAMDANLAAIEARLFVPDAYAVVATRHR